MALGRIVNTKTSQLQFPDFVAETLRRANEMLGD
jgi:hypothetical protein